MENWNRKGGLYYRALKNEYSMQLVPANDTYELKGLDGRFEVRVLH